MKRTIVGCLVFLFPFMSWAQDAQMEPADFETIQAAIDKHPAKIKIVNFWATWCVPCLEEFPYFMEVDERFDDEDVAVLFVSMDFEEEEFAALDFLDEQGWTKPSFLRIGYDDEFIPAMHEDWTGALPATIFYDANDQVRDFVEGKTTLAYLVDQATALLNE